MYDVLFESAVIPNSYFTLKAFKRLERVCMIPVLTGKELESNISGIKLFAGFNLRKIYNEGPAIVIQYMGSWLQEYENKENTSVRSPTWKNFMDALHHMKLFDMREKIENCLNMVPEDAETQVEKLEGIIL